MQFCRLDHLLYCVYTISEALAEKQLGNVKEQWQPMNVLQDIKMTINIKLEACLAHLARLQIRTLSK